MVRLFGAEVETGKRSRAGNLPFWFLSSAKAEVQTGKRSRAGILPFLFHSSAEARRIEHPRLVGDHRIEGVNR